MQKDAVSSKLLSRSEAAPYLGVKPQTLAAWASSKRYNLPYIKCGSRVLYRISDLDTFLMANTIGGF
ncbi:MAG: helix-turn-helix domain-containing protein [Candidatus Accumulibacter sp. UW25]|jgi:excisionase family DNA binding protein